MDPIAGVFLLVGAVLGVMAFRITAAVGWGLPTAIVFGLVPPTATFFFGAIGLLASAAFVGGLYKTAG